MISDYAHHVLGDGDDLIITDSFEAVEENCSTLGNASHVIGMTPTSQGRSSKALNSAERITIKMVDSYGNEEASEEIDLVERGARHGPRVEREPLKTINRVITSIRERNRLINWRTRKSAIPVLRPSPTSSYVREYQEISEEEEEATQTADSVTIMSFRSSRKNVGTGRSMLVRQNAQVFGRPSMAQTRWDISSSLSSSEASSDKSLPRKRNVTLDNTSQCSGLSDITEDTAFHKLKQIDHYMVRHNTSFVNHAHVHFGDTFCIDEVEESESDEDHHSNNRSRYDFRCVNVEQRDPWDPLVTRARQEENLPSPRQRTFSDSDIIPQKQHQWSGFYQCPSSSGSSSGIIDNASVPFSSVAKLSQLKRASYEGFSLAEPTLVQRHRTHSDSYVSEIASSQWFDDSFPWGDKVEQQQVRTKVNADRTTAVCGYEETDIPSVSRSRAFSDSSYAKLTLVQRHRTHSDSYVSETVSSQWFDDSFPWGKQQQARTKANADLTTSVCGYEETDIPSVSRSRELSDSFQVPRSNYLNQMTETETMVNTKMNDTRDDHSNMAFHARRLSSALLSQKYPSRPYSSQQSSLSFTNLSSTSSNDAASPCMESDTFGHGSSSWGVSGIRQKIAPTVVPVASEAIPVPTSTVSTSQVQDYYWDGGTVDEDDVVWPSVRSDDTFADTF